MANSHILVYKKSLSEKKVIRMTLKIEGQIGELFPGKIQTRTPVATGKEVTGVLDINNPILKGPGEGSEDEPWGGEDPGGHGRI